jgi:ubiquinone/menaquinone biosynthesis C-methylase UbiE
VSYDPELYDVVTPATLQGDVDWYRLRAMESGGPVLELGAGTGRVTLAIAGAGVAIHALDASEEMLAALERKRQSSALEVRERIRLVHGDMRTFDLRERFPLIISPFRAFLHNVSEADQLACLARVRRHLRPGGQFLFNVFHPSLEIMSRHTGPLEGVWRWAATYDLPAGGFVVRSEANHFDTVRRVVHSQHRYDEHDSAGVLTRTLLHRLELAYLYPPDIRRLLVMSGFTDIQIAGGFDGREFSRDTDELVVEAVAGAAPDDDSLE